MASLVFAASGTFALITYADGKYATLEQAKITQEHVKTQMDSTERHIKESMEEIKKTVDKLDSKIDRLLETRR